MLKNGSKGYLVALSIVLGSCLGLPSANLSAGSTKSHQAKSNQQLARCKRCSQRPLSPNRQGEVYKKIATQAEKTRIAMVGKDGPHSPSAVEARCIFSQSEAPIRPFYRIHEDAKRLGDVITLKDGSQFTVREADQEIVKNWHVGTPITFTPNVATFWDDITGATLMHKYKVVNLDTNESVEANLSKGPFVNSLSVRRIRRIESQGNVYLSDGTVWNSPTTGLNGDILREWKRGDYVILGRNDTWYSFQNQDMIINVSADNWAPALRVNFK